MRDQAEQLRHLMRQSMLRRGAAGISVPRLVALTGGKGGVGTTTLAANLAAALARHGKRVVLVDGDLLRGDIAAICGVGQHHSVADILGGRCDLHEVLSPGPAGMQVATAPWAPGEAHRYTDASQDRLLGQLRSLGRHADVVVLDTGNGADRPTSRFWLAADQIALVTASDDVSVMDAYATVKVLLGKKKPSGALFTIVNLAPDDDTARNVHHRLARSCHRFLGLDVATGGAVPVDPQLSASAKAGRLAVADSPQSAAARAVARIAATLAANAPPTTRAAA